MLVGLWLAYAGTSADAQDRIIRQASNQNTPIQQAQLVQAQTQARSNRLVEPLGEGEQLPPAFGRRPEPIRSVLDPKNQVQNQYNDLRNRNTRSLSLPSSQRADVTPATGAYQSAAPSSRVISRPEQYHVQVPYTDPSTGAVMSRTETHFRDVPVSRYQSNAAGLGSRSIESFHSPIVMSLVSEAQTTSEDDPNREKKIEEIREQLETEFDRMHSQQAKEIESAQKRLSSLQEVHAARMENRDKIVQRRINQLLGKWDVLDWRPSSRRSLSNQPLSSRSPFNSSPSNQSPSNQFPSNQSNVQPRHVIEQSRTFTTQVPFSDFDRGTFHQKAKRSNDPFVEPRDASQSSPETGFPRIPSATTLERQVQNNTTSMVFELARRSAQARNELDTLQQHMLANEELYERGAMPLAELKQKRAALKNTIAKVQLNELERKAIEDSLTLDLREAESEAERYSLQLRSIGNEKASTRESRQQRAELEANLQKAKDAIRRTELSIKQTKDAFDALIASESSEDDSGEDDFDESDSDQGSVDAEDASEPDSPTEQSSF
jgi:hypothetical protein